MKNKTLFGLSLVGGVVFSAASAFMTNEEQYCERYAQNNQDTLTTYFTQQAQDNVIDPVLEVEAKRIIGADFMCSFTSDDISMDAE